MSRTSPCPSCPWRLGQSRDGYDIPNYDIPNYDVSLVDSQLAGVVAPDGSDGFQ